jgi:hypothetical protein
MASSRSVNSICILAIASKFPIRSPKKSPVI